MVLTGDIPPLLRIFVPTKEERKHKKMLREYFFQYQLVSLRPNLIKLLSIYFLQLPTGNISLDTGTLTHYINIDCPPH
jgi:hypothetical protein